jgi:hypothetical protein
MKLFLKGNPLRHARSAPSSAVMRCPGMHNSRRGKLTDYGVHLAREAKGQALLRRAGAPVPHLFSAEADALEGQHGRLAHEPCLSVASTTSCIVVGFGLPAALKPVNWFNMVTSRSTAVGVDIPSYLVKAGRRHSREEPEEEPVRPCR